MRLGYVTGATGCVGRNLVDELLQSGGWDVVVLHRKSSDLSRLKGCRVRFQEMDLYDAVSTRASVQPEADAIFHVAGNTSHLAREADQQWKDNVLVTRNLVEAALASRVKKFIFTSTGATLPYQGADERLTMEIPDGYVRTKRLAELELFKAMPRGLYAVLLHPIIIIGPYDYNNYAQIFSELRSGKIKQAFPGRISFCHAADVARAHIQAFEKGRPFESYVLGGTYTTWLDLFQRIASVVGATPPRKAASPWVLNIVAQAMVVGSFFTRKEPLLTPDLISLLMDDAPDVSFCEQRKAKEELGYESRSLDAMISDCYRWLLKEGRIATGQPTR
jgi:nucleoside-diphosphate-sugar epimerase